MGNFTFFVLNLLIINMNRIGNFTFIPKIPIIPFLEFPEFSFY